MKKIVLFILFFLLISVLIFSTVNAAKIRCRDYKVVRNDTYTSVAKMWGRLPGQIVLANKFQNEAPNYAIYVNQYLCKPDSDERNRNFGAAVYNAPAGYFSAYTSNKLLILTVNGFSKGSNWFVITDGKKIGKVKPTVKAEQVFKYGLKSRELPKIACLKNMQTDLLLCTTIIRR